MFVTCSTLEGLRKACTIFIGKKISDKPLGRYRHRCDGILQLMLRKCDMRSTGFAKAVVNFWIS